MSWLKEFKEIREDMRISHFSLAARQCRRSLAKYPQLNEPKLFLESPECKGLSAEEIVEGLAELEAARLVCITFGSGNKFNAYHLVD